MPKVTLDTNVDRVRDSAGQFLKGLNGADEEQAEEMADHLVDLIKKSINDKGMDFSGDLKNNVHKEKSVAGEGVAFDVLANAYNNGVNYAAWHEFAQDSHFVPLTADNSPIQRWARSKGIDAYGIEVSPINQTEGSFMERPVSEEISKTRKDLRSGDTPVQEIMEDIYS